MTPDVTRPPSSSPSQHPLGKTAQHLAFCAEIANGKSIPQFILDNGMACAIGPQTFDGPRDEQGMCFLNAAHKALGDSSLTYVEGMVSVFGISIDHAWCIDANGTVIDSTLVVEGSKHPDRISDYFGVPFRSEYLRAALLTNGYYGLLGWDARETADKLVELGLEQGQQWLLDGGAKKTLRRTARRGRSTRR